VKLCLITVLLAAAGIAEFRGPARLAASIKDPKAELLVYSNNGNDVGLLTKGAVLPLNLDTRLWVPGACCLHQATPSLSPDGGRIAYVHLSSVQPRQEKIKTYNRDSRQEGELFQAETIWGIAWAPDGDHLAVIADKAPERTHNLYLVDLRSNAFTQLSHGTLNLGDKQYTVSGHAPPSWSSSGKQLVIEVRTTGAQAENSGSSAVALWDTETNEVRKLTDGVEPAWSPTKDLVAFFDSSRQECFTIRPDGGEKELLFALGKRGFASRSARLFFPVVWSPDGNQLIFHQWVDADWVLDVYRLDLKRNKPEFLSRSEVQVVNWRIAK